MLVALKLYSGDDPGQNSTTVTLVPTFTGNRKNRLGFEQADEHEISFFRAPDGVVCISQEKQEKGSSGVGAQGVQQRGGRTRQRCH